LKQEDIKHINFSISRNSIEGAIKVFSSMKSPVPDRITAEFSQIFMEDLTSITLISKPHKYTT
jgi:hypothetical protein